MRGILKQLIIIFIGLNIALSLIANQGRALSIKRLGLEDGLSQSNVNCMVQDKQGYIWIGTDDGLNRFDGYEFKLYYFDREDTTSISSNAVASLYEDNEGQLWVGTTESGICIYNREKDNFQRKNLIRNIQTKVNDIIQNTEGDYYFGTNSGLFHFIPSKKVATRIKSQVTLGVSSLEFNKEGTLFIGTHAAGLYFLNKDLPQNEIVKFHDKVFGLSLEKSGVNELFFDGHYLWIAAGENMYYYDGLELKAYDKVNTNNVNNIQYSWQSIAQDNNGNKLFGSESHGVKVIGAKDEKTDIVHKVYDPFSIANNNVKNILIDNQGNVWFGHYGGGISILPKQKKIFTTLQRSEFVENTLSHAIVNAVKEDSKGRLWIGTWGGGLNLFDRKTNLYTHYKANTAKPNTLSNNVVRCIFEDSENNIWVCTNDGLNRFNEKQNNFTVYNSGNTSGSAIYMMIEDKPGVFLLVTSGMGLIEYHWKSDTTHVYTTKNSELASNYIRVIAKDREGNLYLGYHGEGLGIFNRTTNTFKNFKLDRNDPKSLSNNVIYSLFIDSKDKVWIGTMGGGLNFFNNQDSSFTNFTRKDGLPNEVINAITDDSYGNIWLSTNRGISKFTPPYYYKGELIPLQLAFEKGEKGYFKNFGINDGIQSSEFKPNCFTKGIDGEIYFGGVEGLSFIHPDNINQEIVFPEVIISDLLLFNKKIDINDTKVPILEKNISVSDRITFTHKQSLFTLKFTALHYSSPENLNYAYRLKGFSDEWNYIGNNRSATYTNLNPGNYEFQVIASTNPEVWDYNAKKIQIKILPPFYRTNLAYGLYVLFVFLLVMLLRWLIIRRERINYKLQENINEKERLLEVDKIKMRFFTNISHEFKTPLSLISGPLEVLIDRYKEDVSLSKQLNLMQRNSKHLLRLINQLLDVRKLELGNLTLKASTGDFVSFVKEITLSFQQSANHKKIKLEFNSAVEYQLAWFDPDLVEKIVFNLLSNALKFTPSGGSIEVSISTTLFKHLNNKFNFNSEDNEEYIKVEVVDTGVGIAPEFIDKVFNRFYQVPSSGVLNKEGTGIGLSLVKELLLLHKGDIELNSTVGKGCEFTFYIPIGQHFVDVDDVKEFEPNSSDIISLDDQSDVENSFDTSKETILIVEDNHEIKNFIRDNLKESFNILEASNGHEGLEIAKENLPSVILTDVMMPIMDGLELCKKLKLDELTCHIPVIILSAKSSDDSKLLGMDSGADDYIAKPFNIQILKKKVKRFIENQQRIKDYFRQKLTISPKDVTVTSQDEKLLSRVMEIIEANISNAEFTVEDFTKEIGMGNTQFYTKLKAITGMSANNFLRAMRLKRALQYMEAGVTSISEIAYDVGFNNPKYFSKCFKEEFGKVPSDFIKK